MFSRNKIAAVLGLLGGLSMTCVGVAQAHGKGPSNGCKRDGQGNVTCVRKSQTIYTTKDGKHIVVKVKQTQNCSTASRHRLLWPGINIGGTATSTTEIGPKMSCSNNLPRNNNASLPDGLTLPSFLLP
ncbi:hypothetical protein NGB36_06815 [Streptomyces sp. RB6PN25]|uniref:Lipoprotein n=1 Tax=Streptomyces humicola TaxID=2953240 RepID=A0ABT1PUW0_9ACTN|nr:hypothetical protein [Streptomyces humicola]MCQ4080315.1 hypothetical protein [Streptomyces humicola]